jgi:hypothetical protein
MAYVLWAAEVKPQDTSIDANASRNSLQRLQEDTRGSQPGCLSPGVIFSARQPLSTQLLYSYHWELRNYPRYSRDLFWAANKRLTGRRFHNNEKVEKAIREWL